MPYAIQAIPTSQTLQAVGLRTKQFTRSTHSSPGIHGNGFAAPPALRTEVYTWRSVEEHDSSSPTQDAIIGLTMRGAMKCRANQTAAFSVSTGRLSPESAKTPSSLQPLPAASWQFPAGT